MRCEEIQTQTFGIYNINDVMWQTLVEMSFFSHNWINKLFSEDRRRWRGPPPINKVYVLLMSVCLLSLVLVSFFPQNYTVLLLKVAPKLTHIKTRRQENPTNGSSRPATPSLLGLMPSLWPVLRMYSAHFWQNQCHRWAPLAPSSSNRYTLLSWYGAGFVCQG